MKSLQSINNEEFENAVLGSILIDPKVMDRVSILLGTDDFYRSANRELYSLLLKMHKADHPIDLMTVFEYAKQLKADRTIGGSQRLIYLTETTPTSVNADFYAGKVKEYAERREMVEQIDSIITGVASDTLSLDDAKFMINKISSNQQRPSGLKMICAKDITPCSAPVQSLWGEVLYPCCITQINSEPGVGKTTFVYNLCIAGAKGSAFLGIEFSSPLRVLYIDVETPSWKRAIKLATITEGALPESLFFLESLDMHSQFSDLLALCADERIDLVVFDTQSRIFNLENENDNSDANRMMNMLRRLVSECGCSVVLVHHTSKSDKKGVYSGRGASAIGGAVDVVVNMESLDPESIKLKVDKNRISGDYMTLFIRKTGDEKFEQFVPEGQTLSGFEKFKVQEFILGLSEKKSVWTTLELQYECQEQGHPRSTVTRAISNLAQSGKLIKIKKGEYEFNC